LDTQTLKIQMPETYKAIQAKAGEIGNRAYGYVKQGLAGQPNRFYAIERGHVAGTPFDLPNVNAELAKYMVEFGCSFLIMWAPEAQQPDKG
jgi:hypothetical protein